MEEWKVIDGFDLYEISNFGNVRSFHNNRHGRSQTPKIVKLHKNNRGYYYFDFCKNGTKQKLLIHRVIATAFIPNPTCLEHVDHVDRNTSNNNINNLRWCSRSQNMRNTKLSVRNKSGEKNIRWCEKRQSWQVQILICGTKYRRRIKDFDEAVKYRDTIINTHGSDI